tara:strand:+ start:549 stop:1247 length:699 start_codon:yes stop_codon:yes gene_type:complete
MPYFLLGFTVLAGILLIFLGLRKKHPQNYKKILAIIINIVAVGLILFLAFSGRLGWLGWLLLALPAILQWRSILRTMKNARGPSPGKRSKIETEHLRMDLEHDSGVLSGTVLKGKFKGKTLAELDMGGLLELFREFRITDPESAKILETYLDKLHGAAWRETFNTGDSQPSPTNGMSTDEAFEILGLPVGSTADEIREAHRKLLKANHPDKGGSTWVASQINRAKDKLIPNG